MKLKFWEWLLIICFSYTLLWTLNDYLASLITLIFCPLSGSILLLSYVAEWIQKSKVPPSYFAFMWACFLAPLIISIIYVMIFNGQIEWIARAISG